MSGYRYLVLIARDPEARSAWEQSVAPALGAYPGFEMYPLGDRGLLVARSEAPLPIGGAGYIVGRLFERGRARRVERLDAETASSVAASCGERLISAFWGPYVALVVSPGGAPGRDSLTVVRGPLSDLGCYTVETPFGLALASDIDLLCALAGYIPQIDWTSVARKLAAGDLGRRQTCLAGVAELAGGERLIDRAGHRSIEEIWPVWNFVSARERQHDPVEATRRIGDAVGAAIEARARDQGRIVLRLSGGLDSSIVAASLAKAGHDFVGLTMVTRDRIGDERIEARAAAAHLGIELVETVRTVEHVDLQVSAAAGMPNPSARAFAQATMHVAIAMARDRGAKAIFDGGGGDNMFAALYSPAPVADCLEPGGGAGYFWRTARSIGLTGATGTLAMAQRALVRKWTRGPAYRWPVNLALLSEHGVALAQGAVDHPWLLPPTGVLPGSAAHVALVLGAQSVMQGCDARDVLPSVSPLISQPVAEACLRIPSWLWTRDGHNRVAARDAFATLLPPEIAYRRDKGAPDSFVIELIEANFELLRAMLTEGELVRHGIVDPGMIALALRPAQLAKGYGYVRLMQLIDVEAWARSWLGDCRRSPKR